MFRTQASRPLPGQRPAVPPGMFNYVVTLREEEQAPTGRRAIYDRNLARTSTFQRGLLRTLEERGLLGELGGMGESMGFPVVTLTATPQVAQVIESLPEVESVYRDDDTLQLIR
jgi:hypothetical protein